MKRSITILAGAFLAIFLLVSLSCSLPTFTGDPSAAGPKAVLAAAAAKAPEVSDPGQAGPYAVGHTYFLLQDPSRLTHLWEELWGDRPIPVEVFYPVDPSTVAGSASDAVFPLDPVRGFWPDTVSADWEAYGNDPAWENRPPSPRKPFPLLMFSPGWGCSIWASNFLAGRLATHGFVVAVPYHYGEWAFPYEPLEHIALASLNRPKDMSLVLNHLLGRNATAGDLLSGTIKPDRVAASGFSLGGYTSVVLACGVSSVGEIFQYPEYQELLGPMGLPFGPPPEQTMVPQPPDPRFKAILPLDGASWLLRFSDLARVTVPSMGIGEEWSTLAQDPDPMWASWQARQHAAFPGHPNYRVDISGTNHQSFSNLYEGLTLAWQKGYLPDADYQWFSDNFFQTEISSNEANRLTARYAVAFLKTILAGESGYQSYLTPGYAHTREQYIEFFVTEKRSPSSIQEDWPFVWPSLSIYFAHQPGSWQAKAAKKP